MAHSRISRWSLESSWPEEDVSSVSVSSISLLKFWPSLGEPWKLNKRQFQSRLQFKLFIATHTFTTMWACEYNERKKCIWKRKEEKLSKSRHWPLRLVGRQGIINEEYKASFILKKWCYSGYLNLILPGLVFFCMFNSRKLQWYILSQSQAKEKHILT